MRSVMVFQGSALHGCVLLLLCGLLSGCSCGGGVVSLEPATLQTNLRSNQLVFTNVPTGTRKRKTFRLSLRSPGTVLVQQWKIQEEVKGSFRVVSSPALPFTLDSNGIDGVFLTVEYNSLAEGTVRGSLLVQANNAANVDANGVFRIPLQHLRERSSPVWSCDGKLNFGQLPAGESRVKKCELRNTAGAPLTLSGVTYVPNGKNQGTFSLLEPGFPLTLPPDGVTKATFVIRWTPELVSLRESGRFLFRTPQAVLTRSRKLELEVSVNVASARMVVTPLYGGCVTDRDCEASDLRLRCAFLEWRKGSFCVPKRGQPPLLSFPATREKQASRMAFAVHSRGDLPLEVKAIELPDKANSPFKVLPTAAALPWKLRPGERKVVEVEFRPTDLTKSQQALWLRSNDRGQPRQEVRLEGNGRGCRIEASPRAMTFFRERSQQLLLSNKGSGLCNLLELRLRRGNGQPFSFQRDRVPGILRPGQSVRIAVLFNPGQKLHSQDELLIRSDDVNSPLLTVSLKVGDPLDECKPQLRPSQRLDFGQVRVGGVRALPVSLVNRGEGHCLLSSVAISSKVSQGKAAFRWKQTPQMPLRVGPGQTITWNVEFSPLDNQPSHEGRLVVGTSSLQTPTLALTLTGRETSKSCLQLLPSLVRFTKLRRSCASLPKEVELFFLRDEKCPATVSITNASLSQETSAEFVVSSKVMLPATLRQGESLKLQVTYKPQDLTEDRGTLIVSTNAPSQPTLRVPLLGDSSVLGEQRDVFVVPAKSKVDVLFVVDDSSSMADRQKNLAQNFKAFIQWATGLKNDFHIGIVSTDTSGNRFSPGCLRGSPRVLTDKTPNLAEVFSRNVKLGTLGSGNEKGLEAAYQALSAPRLLEFRCNQGFLRKDAGLSLIFVSDEQDNSPQSVAYYQRFLESLKQGAEWVRVSAIVAPPPSGCKNGSKSSQAAPRYWELAKHFGGVRSSICKDDWSKALSNIGIITLGARSEWVLRQPAIEASILVRVNGALVPRSSTDGWIYAADLNSVVFSKNRVPPVGAKIEVSYKVKCLP